MFKKIWEKIKAFGVKIWGKIKAWFNNTALPWLKKEWMQIVNLLVLFIIYGNTDSLPGVQTIAGLWVFVLLVYYIFWKFFGFNKVWAAYREQKKSNGTTTVNSKKVTKPTKPSKK